MSALNTKKNAPTTAIVTTKLSKFVFDMVSKGQWPASDLTGLAATPRKLFSALQTQKYHSYLIDLNALTGDAEDVAESIIQLREATGAPIIIFASGYAHDNPLVETLQNAGLAQWVLSKDLTTMYEQLAECWEGSENAIVLAEQARLEKEHLEQNVAPGHRTIGFIGSSPGTGTTTQAMQFAMYLQSCGHTACYIEAGAQHHVEKIPSFTASTDLKHLDKEKGYLQYKGLDMYYKPVLVTPNMRLAYDVCVYDYGVLSADNISSFLSNTALACVAGSKPWEYGILRWVFNMLNKAKVMYLFPFVDKRERPNLLQKIDNRDNVTFPAFAPDPFTAPPANKKIYQELGSMLLLGKNMKIKRRKA